MIDWGRLKLDALARAWHAADRECISAGSVLLLKADDAKGVWQDFCKVIMCSVGGLGRHGTPALPR